MWVVTVSGYLSYFYDFNTFRNYLWDSAVMCYFKEDRKSYPDIHWHDRWRHMLVSASSQQFQWAGEGFTLNLIWSQTKLGEKNIVLRWSGVGYPHSRLHLHGNLLVWLQRLGWHSIILFCPPNLCSNVSHE